MHKMFMASWHKVLKCGKGLRKSSPPVQEGDDRDAALGLVFLEDRDVVCCPVR